ncbi:hypothetical protein AB0I81_58165 [Nonomuraea sp. NPDC050404]|uniref:hypothetical protein n=1 Tax=Nonomuraea sp. NPDC050404 TaxID=3155783 RepID=UPI0033F74B64
MDVETELLNLKRRLWALEASTSINEQNGERGTAAVAGGTVVAELHREVSDDLKALNVEVAGLRWQTKEYCDRGHSQLLERLDDLRIGLHHLDLKLDQLLVKDAVEGGAPAALGFEAEPAGTPRKAVNGAKRRKA